MTAMWNDFSSLQSLINMLNWCEGVDDRHPGGFSTHASFYAEPEEALHTAFWLNRGPGRSAVRPPSVIAPPPPHFPPAARYFALNGINILLLIARILRLMDFQPRLGVVTRSLWLAGPDLIHFFIVASMVFIGYSMMAHLIFGNVIEVLFITHLIDRFPEPCI